MTDETTILKKLDDIKSDLDFLKSHMIDTDMILTDDDIQSIKDAEKDLKTGKATRIV